MHFILIQKVSHASFLWAFGTFDYSTRRTVLHPPIRNSFSLFGLYPTIFNCQKGTPVSAQYIQVVLRMSFGLKTDNKLNG